MEVSIIIVNYNTYHYVLDCIKSVKELTADLTYELIVVDNNSPNRDIMELTSIHPDVRLILNPSNTGFGAGNNLGVKQAMGKKLFFLNSDTLLRNNAIKILSDFLTKNEDTAVCGPNLYNLQNQPANSFSRIPPSIFADIDYFFFNVFSKIRYKNNLFFNPSNKNITVKGSISGASYLVQKEIFEKVGGFDEAFFMYYEETELSHRIKKAGFKLANVPAAKIIHFEGGSEVIKERSLEYTLASKRKYFVKTSNIFHYYLSNVVFFCTIVQRLLIFTIFNNKEKKRYWLSFYRWAMNQF